MPILLAHCTMYMYNQFDMPTITYQLTGDRGVPLAPPPSCCCCCCCCCCVSLSTELLSTVVSLDLWPRRLLPESSPLETPPPPPSVGLGKTTGCEVCCWGIPGVTSAPPSCDGSRGSPRREGASDAELSFDEETFRFTRRFLAGGIGPSMECLFSGFNDESLLISFSFAFENPGKRSCLLVPALIEALCFIGTAACTGRSCCRGIPPSTTFDPGRW